MGEVEPTVFLRLFYDGEGYSGWAKQPHRRTIQGELERALKISGAQPVRLGCASRTDAGVSALRQVVRVKYSGRLVPEALNRLLPPSVAVTHIASKASGPFGKRYLYLTGRKWVPSDRLRRALRVLESAQPVSRLFNKGGSAPSGGLQVSHMRLGGFIALVFEAPGFGWKEVRRTVGALDVVVSGSADPEEVLSLRAARPAEPLGLLLLEVSASADWRPVHSGLLKARHYLLSKIERAEWTKQKWLYAYDSLT
ncbi:MAG: hypothetical protein QW767_06310 [Thermoprotei archaeon]